MNETSNSQHVWQCEPQTSPVELATLSSDFSIRLDQSSRCEIRLPRPAKPPDFRFYVLRFREREFAGKPRDLGDRKPKSTQVEPDFRRSIRLRLRVLHRVNSSHKAMSRQAGPSIVLSVLIVCFFAVALFQRDLPTRRSAQARSRRRRRSRRVQSAGLSPRAGSAGRTPPILPNPASGSECCSVVPRYRDRARLS